MYISLLKAKLHHARVTGADLNYVGSLTVDSSLLEQAGIHPYEKVLVVDIENGARFETYIIPGEAGSGTICVNGAAARLVSHGDLLIIMAFVLVESPPPPDWVPCILTLDADNQITPLTT